MVHRKVGVPLADLFTTPKSLSVTGFFFEVDKYVSLVRVRVMTPL